VSSDPKPENARSEEPNVSCDPNLTRKEFVALVLKRGAIAGAILAAPRVLDKFLVAPGLAANPSSGTGAAESGNSGKEP